MKCPNCEHDNNVNMKYCTNCGTKLPMKNKKNKIIIASVVAVFCIASIVSLGMFLNQAGKMVNVKIKADLESCKGMG